MFLHSVVWSDWDQHHHLLILTISWKNTSKRFKTKSPGLQIPSQCHGSHQLWNQNRSELNSPIMPFCRHPLPLLVMWSYHQPSAASPLWWWLHSSVMKRRAGHWTQAMSSRTLIWSRVVSMPLNLRSSADVILIPSLSVFCFQCSYISLLDLRRVQLVNFFPSVRDFPLADGGLSGVLMWWQSDNTCTNCSGSFCSGNLTTITLRLVINLCLIATSTSNNSRAD